MQLAVCGRYWIHLKAIVFRLFIEFLSGSTSNSELGFPLGSGRLSNYFSCGIVGTLLLPKESYGRQQLEIFVEPLCFPGFSFR